MSDTTPAAAPTPAETAAQIAAAERRGFFKGQVVATRTICEFFGLAVREVLDEGAVDIMLEESRASYAAERKNGKAYGDWNEDAERSVIAERVAIVTGLLGKIVEGVALGAHMPAEERHKITDRAGAEWVLTRKLP